MRKIISVLIVLSFMLTLLPANMRNALSATMDWQVVGSVDFSGGTAGYTSIVIDSSGTPYVVYVDNGNSGKATVMKYNGTGWVLVGSAGFSVDEVDYTNIVIDSSGTPYVVYKDKGNSGKATVMKYNGTDWVPVGSAGFSTDEVDYTSIAIDSSGTPYIVYMDSNSMGKATVMKYNGTGWDTVGSAGFSENEADFTSIVIDGSGTPYVAYRDYGNLYKATVMKYNGAGWVPVGSAGFSAGMAIFINIALDSSGAPYVVYVDANSIGKAIVMKYASMPTYTVTYNQGEQGSISDPISEAVTSGGNPVTVPTVTANHGYAFAYWSSNGGTTQLTSQQLAAQTITGNVTYTAYYTRLISSSNANITVDDTNTKITYPMYSINGTNFAQLANIKSVLSVTSGYTYEIYIPDGTTVATAMDVTNILKVLQDGNVVETYTFAANIKYGDVNGDGVINTADLVLLARYVVNPTTYPLTKAYGKTAADINQDDTVNSSDKVLLQQYLTNPQNYPLESTTFLYEPQN